MRFEIESGGGELLKIDCPIRRHLKVIMVVVEEKKKKVHMFTQLHVLKLLSGENFNCLEGRQNWDTLDIRSCG